MFQLKVRDERLGEASDLQKFFQNLDHFQKWLTQTQTSIASEDIPSTLAEAEKLLNNHQQIKEEIDAYAPEYSQMKEYGVNVVEGQDDAQYVLLREVSCPFVSVYFFVDCIHINFYLLSPVVLLRNAHIWNDDIPYVHFMMVVSVAEIKGPG